MWSKVKNSRRAAEARTHPDLELAVAAAFKSVTAQDAAGWFISCGYHLNQNALAKQRAISANLIIRNVGGCMAAISTAGHIPHPTNWTLGQQRAAPEQGRVGKMPPTTA